VFGAAENGHVSANTVTLLLCTGPRVLTLLERARLLEASSQVNEVPQNIRIEDGEMVGA
jgi:hypothetical protein